MVTFVTAQTCEVVNNTASENIIAMLKSFFIVILPGYGVRYLIDINQLVHHNHHARIARQTEKGRKELEVVIPVVIGDNHVYAEGLLRLAFERIFAPEPADDLCLLFVVALYIGAVVGREELCELKAVHQLADRGGNGVDFSVGGGGMELESQRCPRRNLGHRVCKV